MVTVIEIVVYFGHCLLLESGYVNCRHTHMIDNIPEPYQA